MRVLSIQHVTTYRYARPVVFGDHRLMLRPRDSHDLRLLETRLTIRPEPAAVRWLHDVFGNSVTIVSFDSPADVLSIESAIKLEHFETSDHDCPLEPYAATYPFTYSAVEVPDLNRLLERRYPDPEHAVDRWAKRFLQTDGPTETVAMLAQMTKAIKQEGFNYTGRLAEGCQAPVETLRLRSGSCRDFALLMMEAARALGLAARFVSGYIYVPADQSRNLGGGATHAWLQIYLPGAGWMEFDPTNGIVGNRDLIRVAVVRDPSQAIPVSGTWTGAAGDYRGMEVDVKVMAEN
jgi:transglutaminase-like putative cysteine protease